MSKSGKREERYLGLVQPPQGLQQVAEVAAHAVEVLQRFQNISQSRHKYGYNGYRILTGYRMFCSLSPRLKE